MDLVPDEGDQAGAKKLLDLVSRLHAVRQMAQLFNEHGPSMHLTNHLHNVMPNFSRCMVKCEERLGSNLPILAYLLCFSCARSFFSNREENSVFVNDTETAEFFFDHDANLVEEALLSKSKKKRKPVLKADAFKKFDPRFGVAGCSNSLGYSLSEIASFILGDLDILESPFPFLDSFDKKLLSFPLDEVLQLLEASTKCSKFLLNWIGSSAHTAVLLGFQSSNSLDQSTTGDGSQPPQATSVGEENSDEEAVHGTPNNGETVLDSYNSRCPYEKFCKLSEEIKQASPNNCRPLMEQMLEFHQKEFNFLNNLLGLSTGDEAIEGNTDREEQDENFMQEEEEDSNIGQVSEPESNAAIGQPSYVQNRNRMHPQKSASEEVEAEEDSDKDSQPDQTAVSGQPEYPLHLASEELAGHAKPLRVCVPERSDSGTLLPLPTSGKNMSPSHWKTFTTQTNYRENQKIDDSSDDSSESEEEDDMENMKHHGQAGVLERKNVQDDQRALSDISNGQEKVWGMSQRLSSDGNTNERKRTRNTYVSEEAEEKGKVDGSSDDGISEREDEYDFEDDFLVKDDDTRSSPHILSDSPSDGSDDSDENPTRFKRFRKVTSQLSKEDIELLKDNKENIR
jgi:hypothetical protein